MERATAEAELSAIRSLMHESQSFLSGTWAHQLLWGLIGSVSLAVTWAAVRAGTYALIGWVWAVALAGGWIASVVLGRRQLAGAPVHNVASRAFAGIWIGLGVTLTLLGSVAVLSGTPAAGVIDPSALPGTIALIFGAGYFASGFLAGLRWLQGVGAVWWASGVALLFWDAPHSLLALAVLTALFEVGPALVLRRAEQRRSG